MEERGEQWREEERSGGKRRAGEEIIEQWREESTMEGRGEQWRKE